MTSIKEVFLSFFEASKERLKNPAIGTFILSWLAINWRFVAILLFSNLPLNDRINQIEDNYLKIELTLWYPLLAMGVYMLVVPNLTAVIDAINQKSIFYRKKIAHENKLSDTNAKNKNSLEDTIAQQEIAAEKRQLVLIQQGSPDINNLKQQIEDLKNQNDTLQKNANSISKENTSKKDTETSSIEPEAKTLNQPIKRSSKKTKPLNNVNDSVQSKPLPTSDNYPAMRDNVIKNVAKSEKEWILIFGFYAGDFGKKEFTRDQIMDAYVETKCKTKSRQMNASNNIGNLVKQGFLRFLNDEEMLLTDAGRALVEEILNR
jgi:hypothetical protein